MLSKKIVATLCFVCFILHSIYLVWNNSSNNKSVSNSKFEDLTTIPFPLKVQVIVEPGMVSDFVAIKSLKLQWLKINFTGFDLTALAKFGFGNLWELFLSDDPSLVEIFKRKDMFGMVNLDTAFTFFIIYIFYQNYLTTSAQ